MERDRREDYLFILSELRAAGINAILYMGDDPAFRAQISQATKREIPVLLICGGREFESNQVALKNMSARKQYTVKREEMVSTVRGILDGTYPPVLS